MAAIDVFRGLAILEVVTHHLTGMAYRHAPAGSLLADVLAVINRTLHFAVPAFLFMTAVVLTRSALHRFEPGRYYRGRALKSALPFVLWTVLYVLFRVLTGQDPPEVLLDPERWQVWLQYGKGYFHLYFLLIALQFYLVLPLLLPLWRRRTSLALVLVIAVAVQLAVYWLNRTGITSYRFPATIALWYVLPITLGMYFGAHYAQFEGFWKRWRRVIGLIALGALLLYLPSAVNALQGRPVSPVLYSLSSWAYTTAMALALFGVAHSITRAPAWFSRPLARMGSVSLQIYLLHPLLLFYLDRWGFPRESAAFVAVLAAYTVAALGVPFLIARLLEGTRLSTYLFGR